MGARQRWDVFWARVGAQGDPGGPFAVLDACYRAAGRAYHGWSHVLDCLDRLDEVRALCGQPDAVEMALWFHDAVYEPRACDNERRSAAMARENAVAMGLDLPFARAVEGLVLATAHMAAPEPGEEACGDAPIMLDIDLSILGRDRDAFEAYDRGIRSEYGHLPDGEYRAGRRRVLESFLERPRIYATEFFSARYEDRARENLTAALEALGDQPPVSRRLSPR